MFVGHHQPKIPYDVGFYNLNDINIMRRQVELAKIYGIYGFCFYYYWFSGKRALEKPLYNFLKSDIDFPFHFCWANENWSKLWDGGNKEVIFEQKLLDDDAKKFFNDIKIFIMDKRYEKIDNKPILMIYRPELFDQDKIKNFLSILNNMAIKNGFDGFYFLSSTARDFQKPIEYGFEGLVEFPPHTLWKKIDDKRIAMLDKKAKFEVADMTNYIKEKKYIYDADYPIFKCCFPTWDNTPRKMYSNGFVFLMNSDLFKSWLMGIIKWTRENHKTNKQYVYINAWNEWAEGAALEPNTRYGYQNLEMVKQAIEETRYE